MRISVIVPVYNVEKYLKKCVQSVLDQDFKDFELILVDDGSTDNSGSICDDYALKDSRIRVIHKKNGGLSDARNKGTDCAKGKYITYVDSDDYISKEYLKTLNNLVEKYSADIAITGIKTFTDGNEPKINNRNIYCEKVYSGIDALKNMLYQKDMDTSACSMLISESIARKHPFPYGKFHEDEFTTYKFYLDASIVAISTVKQYFYRQRKGSIMHSIGQAIIDELDAADNLYSSLSTISDELANAAKSKKFSDYCQVLLSTENLKEEYPELFCRITDFLNMECKEIIKDHFVRIKNKMAALILLIGGVKLLRNVKNFINKFL